MNSRKGTSGMVIIFLTMVLLSCGGSSDKRLKLIHDADTYFTQGKFEWAYPRYLTAHSMDTTDAHVNLYAGISAYKLLNYEEAIRLVTMAIARDSSDTAFLCRGACYLYMEKPEKSEADMKMALHLNPDNSDVLQSLASTAMARGRYREAEDYAVRAKAAGGLVGLKKNKLYMNYTLMGVIMGQTARVDSALIFFQEAIKIDSANYMAYQSRAFMLLQQNRLEPALKDSRKALQLKPDYGYAYRYIADVYIGQKRNKDVCPMLDSAIMYGVPVSDSLHKVYCSK